MDYSDLGKLEKDLENLLANHLLDILFEDAALLPIFQERAMQIEADLYAINQEGDLFIFELKRGFAGSDAMLQILRYSQEAGKWSYNFLNELYSKYANNPNNPSLQDTHKESFNLERGLIPSEFNRKQHLIIIGNAANDKLIESVDYWKKQGLSVEFLPYRIFHINKQFYFEFFSLPYDRHQNPSSRKGVLFDTNRSYDENAVWDMIENDKVSAYGKVNFVVDYLNNKDIVFYSHKWNGIVGAAEIKSGTKKGDDSELYKKVKFLTPKPHRNNSVLKALPFSEVSRILSKTFFWARTIKVPYLSYDEANKLLIELNKYLSI